MGKKCETFGYYVRGEKMRIGMCENLPSASYSSALTSESSDTDDTMRFVDNENNVDVEILKSRLKETGVVDRENRCLLNDSENGSKLSDQEDNASLSSASDRCVEKGENLSRVPSVEQNEERESPVDELDDCCRKENGAMSHHNRYYSNEGDYSESQRLRSGLLITPITLTQDVPVDIEGTNNRLSAVLENIQLPLVYIPTTKQLVAGKKKTGNESSRSNSDSGSQGLPEDVASSEAACALGLSEHDSTSTETILNTDDIDRNIDCSKQSVLETSSLGETDSLLRLKEPDQLTCSSFEMESGLPRVHTGDLLLRTFNDASSLSSLSTCTDFSVSAVSIGEEGEGTGLCIDTGDGGFMEINLHSRNSFERCKTNSQDSGIEDGKGAKSKRKGLSGFLSRNIFSRKPKDLETAESEQQGWKLFGRIPPKPASEKDAAQISEEYHIKQRVANQQVVPPKGSKKQDIEVMSTTALILENRPMNLPTKDPQEAERHRQQYEAMIEAAKKKEQKELKLKKKQHQQQLKLEDQLLAAAKKWTNEILPNWENAKTLKKTKDLWWLGIPPRLRGRVWKLAIGNDLNLTQELYDICVSRAEEKIKLMCESEIYGTSETSSEPPSSKESSVELIKLDVSRTFPQLCIFQKGGPYHDLLHSLLGAYACYRPDVGYVQGMSFIAAVLLLNMDVNDAFICFANLLNRPCQVAFFRLDEELMKYYFETYEEFFQENMPSLYSLFLKHNITSDLYIIDWIFALFSKSLPLDVACRVWDVFCRDGEEFLFRTALGILKLHEDVLIRMDFIHMVQFLTKLPECLCGEQLFRCIDQIKMNIDKKRFTQVLNLKKDSSKENT